MNLGRLAKSLHRDWRSRIIARHARMRDGRPVFCVPSFIERMDDRKRKQAASADGKVIYDNRAAAEAAARELEAAGARPMRAYECKRSRHGHCHLATDSTRGEA